MTEGQEQATSTTRLFVWWLDWNLRRPELKEIFSEYGVVSFVKIVTDMETRKSRGFWFVEFENPEDALRAKEAMDWQELNWRTIKVDFAKERTPRPAQEDE